MPVSRRLFLGGTGDEGHEDNSINGTKEILKTELENSKKKWHYDFENDVPLEGKGNVRWTHQNENGDWIGEITNYDKTNEMENKTVENEPKDQLDMIEDVKLKNEVTPRPTPIKETTPPPVRKRSRADESPTNINAKRNILENI